MIEATPPPEQVRRAIPGLRWWIGGLLFASTVINYLDRQTLSLLAPFLKVQYHWSNTDYANLLIGFRVAYSIGQAAFGRIMDRLGTRRGLSITVLGYSIVSICTSMASGFRSFALCRFLLGAGESGNWPAATKAVSEWFRKSERGLATALFDSGSSIGGAAAPFLVLGIYFRWGWRPAFIIPGLLGFIWLAVWRAVYRPPEEHPHISREELNMILADREDPAAASAISRPRWLDLLKLPQTWGTIVARSFTDPVWFFVADWFPIYLVSKGIALRDSLFAIWIPFIAADLGNFFGGAASGFLIKRGWTVGRARKAIVIFGACGMLLLIPTIATNRLSFIVPLFALSTFCYASYSTMANVLPSDIFHSQSVATVSGMGGAAAGIGTIVAFKLVGYLSDTHHGAAASSFDWILIAAGLIPFAGMILVLALVRNDRSTARRLVRPI
ncbi:MAG TPA: MFS transporter [Candidatus Sulfotelmatobacter sp.]|nr:MFS transporter [Candidatus Sulfotelmatobacter sp.]